MCTSFFLADILALCRYQHFVHSFFSFLWLWFLLKILQLVAICFGCKWENNLIAGRTDTRLDLFFNVISYTGKTVPSSSCVFLCGLRQFNRCRTCFSIFFLNANGQRYIISFQMTCEVPSFASWPEFLINGLYYRVPFKRNSPFPYPGFFFPK